VSKARLLLTTIFLFSIFLSSASAEDRKVTLADGRQVVLRDDFTREYYQQPQNVLDTSSIKDNQIPTFLRQGITADKETTKAAIALYSQGWRYYMPLPKSRQTAWGYGDRRTTWWHGYWVNENTKSLSKDVRSYAMQPDLNIPLCLVAPDERREKVINEVNRPTFRKLDPAPSEICRFISFSTLKEQIKAISHVLRFIKPEFLEEISESCVIEEIWVGD
jgi:hypothetical protein